MSYEAILREVAEREISARAHTKAYVTEARLERDKKIAQKGK
jgi:hypothetical protein